MSEIPADLIELQSSVLHTERRYVDLIASLYGHPWMRRARDEGWLEQAAQQVREAARAA